MGKTENACTMLDEHFGRQLQPPTVEGRVQKLGKWVKNEIRVSGESWDSSSVDIAAAGLGWLAVGLKEEAMLAVWTYDGVEVTAQNVLLPLRAIFLKLHVSDIVSKAHRSRSKQNVKKMKNNSSIEAPPLASSLSILGEDSNSKAVSNSSL